MAFLLKLIPLLLVPTLLILILIGIRRNALATRFRFSDIDVPAAFDTAGYTGSYVSWGIIDHMNRMRDSAGTLSPVRNVRRKDESPLPPLNFQVQGQSIPLEALVDLIWPKWSSSTLAVGGEVGHSRRMASLTIRVGTRSRTLPFPAPNPGIPDSIMRLAAEFILHEAEPHVLASYYMKANVPRARLLLDTISRSKQGRLRAQAMTNLVYLAWQTKDTMVRKESLLALSRGADPTHPGTYVNLAAVYNQRKRNLEALEILNSVRTGEPGWDGLAVSNRAGILIDLGRYEAALEQAKKAIALEDGPTRRYNAAKALVGLKRIEEAKVQFDQALLLSPAAHGIRLTEAIVLAVHGDRASTDGLSRQLQMADSQYALPAAMLRALLISTDSALRSARSFRDVVQADRANSLSTLGEWLSVASKHGEAKILLDEAARLDTVSQLVQWRVARAACWRGDTTEARVRYDRFIGLDERRYGPPTIQVSETFCSSRAH